MTIYAFTFMKTLQILRNLLTTQPSIFHWIAPVSYLNQISFKIFYTWDYSVSVEGVVNKCFHYFAMKVQRYFDGAVTPSRH